MISVDPGLLAKQLAATPLVAPSLSRITAWVDARLEQR